MQTLAAATIEQLRRHAPFDRMAPEHLEFLAARLKLRYFAAEAVILDREMGAPDRIYVIKQGAVIVGAAQRGGPELALQEGECFPLGAMVAGRPVSGTYRASHDTFCFELDAGGFHKLVEMSPVFHDFCTRRIAHLLEHALVNLQSDIAVSTGQRLPLERTLGRIVLREPVTCNGATPIREALASMQREGIGSMLVAEDGRLRGIFTLKDLLGRVALGRAGLDDPIDTVMTPDPVSMPKDAFAYEAALTMSERGIHHLVVMDGDRIAGLVSEKDLFALQRTGLRSVGARMNEATTVEALARIGNDAREMARDLLVQGVEGAHLVRILASLNDRLSRRVIQLELAAAGLPIDELCWIAMGSEGRDERTLASDQDNGIVFADAAGDPEAMRARLQPVAQGINRSLAAVGFPLCRGNIMAGNPKWCLSEGEWRERFGAWIAEPDASGVLGAVIFFDFRPLYGNAALASRLRQWLTAQASDNARFLRTLAENALTNRPPLGIVRDFATGADRDHPDAIDLKVNGTTLFVDAARVLSLAGGIGATNTAERLREAAQAGRIAASDADGWTTAMNFLLATRLRHQHAQIARGEPPDNFVNPERLGPLDRRLLKEALRSARGLQQRLQVEYKLSL